MRLKFKNLKARLCLNERIELSLILVDAWLRYIAWQRICITVFPAIAYILIIGYAMFSSLLFALSLASKSFLIVATGIGLLATAYVYAGLLAGLIKRKSPAFGEKR